MELGQTPQTFFKVVDCIAQTLRTDGATNGASVDTSKFNGPIVFVLRTSTTDGALAVALEDSADNSSFAALTGGSAIFTTLADATGSVSTKLSVLRPGAGTRRYVRPVATVATSSTGVNYGIMALQYGPRDSAFADSTWDKDLYL